MAKGKKGQVLLLALMIMFVGAVILTGLFQYLGTSLLLATRGEENAVNYYAADSGIEDALYSLMNNQSYEQRDYPLNYSNSGMNNRVVNVSIVNNPEGLGNTTYKVTSTATHNKSGESTIIESYVRATPIKFWEFGKDAITSNCDVKILGTKGNVNGDVSYVCDITCNPDPCAVNGTINPPFIDGIPWWPETWAIAQYFKDQVDVSKPFTEDYIDVAVNSTIGPLYRDGDLTIYSSNKKVPVSANLNGVVYVTGDLNIGGTTGVTRDFTLNLSDQVIFVENENAIIGDSIGAGHEDVLINDYCTFTGSGAIFAIGDIWFAPKIETSPEDFMFVMSLEGWLNMQPAGTYYGSVAGNLQVDVSPQNEITRTEGGDDFWNTFFDPEPVISKILTYDIVYR